MRAPIRLIAATLMAAAAPFALAPSAFAQSRPAGPSLGKPLSEAELAAVTGKFLLPNGVELALTITSDTVLNGQAVLRTVLTVDHGQSLQVFGRDSAAAGTAHPYVQAAATPAAISVSFDRQSGLRSIAPVTAGGSAATVNAPTQDAGSLGLVLLPLGVGGPAVATPDGLVSLDAVRGGSQVTLTGDRYAAAHLVGSSVATALVNSGNDRTFDSVTNVAVDLRNALPYQLGSAAMRAENLALEATRGMLR